MKNSLACSMTKLQEYLFVLAVFLLPFSHMPSDRVVFPFTWIGAQMSFYPIAVGAFLWVLSGKFFVKTGVAKIMAIWTVVYIGWGLLCIVIDGVSFPFYDQYSLEADKDKGIFGYVADFLQQMSLFGTNEDTLKALVNIFRTLVHWLLDSFALVIVAAWVYSLFQGRAARGIKLCAYGSLGWLIYCLPWGIIEYAYLQGNSFAASLLERATPVIFDIAKAQGWYPPLLWSSQMRLVFLEPSHLGHYGALILPLSAGMYVVYRKKIYLAAFGIWYFFIFCSLARSAYVIGALAALFLFWYLIFYRRTRMEICHLLGAVGLALTIFICTQGTQGRTTNDMGATTKPGGYGATMEKMVDTYATVASKTRRSNSTRYGTMVADLNIWIKNPVFGVGSMSMRNLYMPDALPKWSLNSREVQYHLNEIIVNSDSAANGRYHLFIALNEYTARLALYGLLGCLLFLFPMSFCLYRIYKKCICGRQMSEPSIVTLNVWLFVSISLVAIDLNSLGVYDTAIFPVIVGLGLCGADEANENIY